MAINKEQILNEIKKELARRELKYFTKYTFEKYEFTNFHDNYCKILQAFAEGKIKKLIVSAPPQHGKSELSTRRLPSFIFGLNPDKKIVIGSYNTTLARKFNRDIQRIITDKEYSEIFPDTQLNNKNVVTVNNYLRNSDEFEIVNKKGGLKAVGRGAGLTGFTVDIAILDDIYKDLQEGNSPVIRESAWDWYTSVIRTRLHNDSQELIVFTRWHNDDIIGRIQKKESVITIKSFDELEKVPKDSWVLINFEAIKTDEKTEIDSRTIGEPLYPQKHSLEKLLQAKTLDSEVFDCLYQGNPISKKGLLYPNGFKTYDNLPSKIIRKAYIDTADSGSDYLCSIVYDECGDGNAYVIDVIYTDEGAENTEKWVAKQLNDYKVNHADIESNSGGKAFARNVESMTNCYIEKFYQKNNKESRIISNASNVANHVIFPDDWHIRFPLFYEHITKFKKVFNSNKHDDCADTVTGVYEKMEKGSNVGIIW
jgi:predicted phage terminase large subunit-like protein